MEESRREKLLNVGIDVDAAMERFVGNEELFVRFLKKFSQDTSYSLLKEAIQNKNYEEAFKAAHTLKGLCGNLSLISLFEVTSKEVEFLRSNKYTEAEEVLPRVIEEYEKIVAVLETI